MHALAPQLLGHLALAGLVAVSASDAALDLDSVRGVLQATQPERLAVVVPAYRGDLSKAVSSLERWPTSCSPVTLSNMDLVLYYAEGEEDSSTVAEAVDIISVSAGRCFSTTRVVYARLDEEVSRK